MAEPKRKKTGTDYYRVRVAFPMEAGAQLEALAAAIHLDVPTLIRVMTSLQLVQWRMIANPRLIMKEVPELEAIMEKGLTEIVPELAGAGVEPEPEPEPEPEQKRDFGLRPRGELDEHSSFDLLAGALAFR